LPGITFRTLGWNAATAGFVLIFSLVFLSVAAHGGRADAAVFGIAAALSLAAAGRILRAALVVSDLGLTVRGFTRTHRLQWQEVDSVSAGDSGNVTGAGRCILIRLTNGRVIRVRGCTSYSTAKVARIAHEVTTLRPGSKDDATTRSVRGHS
jgi:hypothetical protein